MKWMTTKEAASALGKSRQAISKMIKAEKIQHRYIAGRGRGGRTLEVFVDENSLRSIEKKETKQPETQTKQLSNHQENKATSCLVTQRTAQQCNSNSKATNKATPCNQPQTTELVVKRKDGDKFQGGGTSAGTKQPTRAIVRTTDTAVNYEQSPDWIDAKGVGTVLNITRRAAQKRATSEAWTSVTVNDPQCGTRVYYPIECLPPQSRQAWREKQIERWQPLLPALQAAEKQKWESLGDGTRREARARHDIVLEWRAVVKQAKSDGVKITKASASFVNKLKQGALMPEQVALLPGVSVASVRRWDKQLRDGGDTLYPVSLATSGRVGRPKTEVDMGTVNTAVITSVRTSIDLKKVWRGLVEKEWGGVEQVSYATFCRRFRPDDVMKAAVTGPKAINDMLRPHVFVAKDDLLPMMIWMGDGHRMNNACQSPFYRHRNQKYRYMIHPYAHVWIDQYSWMVMGCVLSVTENTHSVMVATGEAVGKWGAPQFKLRTDNGPAWKNVQAWPEYYALKKKPNETALKLQAEGYKGFYKEICGMGPDCSRHPIRRSNNIPGRSESKEVENAFHTIFEEFEQSVSLWTGHNKSDVPERLSGKPTKKLVQQVWNELLPWDEYVAALNEHIERWNNTPRIPGINGELLSPLECYNAVQVDRVSRERILDVYYRYPVTTRLSRDGIILNGIPYWHDSMFGRAGQQVHVHYHEHFLNTVRIADTSGQIRDQSAYAIPASSHVDGERATKAIHERQHAFKRSLGLYAKQHGGLVDAMDDQARAQVRDKDTGVLPKPAPIKELPAPKTDEKAKLHKLANNIPEQGEIADENDFDALMSKVLNLKQLGIGG